METFYTPNDLFFVRNHNAVPVIPEEEYELEVEANEKAGIKARKFTLKELNALPVHEVVSALAVRREPSGGLRDLRPPLVCCPALEERGHGPVKVRRECGMDVDAVALGEEPANANFIAYDTDKTGVPYAGAITV